jgi:eukaryotic translation initiation factor 2C
MVFGADVFHPGREEKGQPSVAAVCASMDKSVTRYVGRCSMNRRIRNETIEGLEGMAIDLLKLFQRRNSVLPFQIVFYRDGVAEGQFEHVLNEEVKALKRAFDRVYGEKDQKYLLSCKNVVMHGKKISYKAFMISFFFYYSILRF